MARALIPLTIAQALGHQPDDVELTLAQVTPIWSAANLVRQCAHRVHVLAGNVGMQPAPMTTSPMPADDGRDLRECLFAAVLRGKDGATRDQSIWTLRPRRELALSASDIRVSSLVGGLVEVSSPVYCHGVHVEAHGREVIADICFDLLPGVPLRVRVTDAAAFGSGAFAAVG